MILRVVLTPVFIQLASSPRYAYVHDCRNELCAASLEYGRWTVKKLNATPSNDSSAPWRTAARMEKACSSTTGDISPTRIAALAILDMSAAAEQPMRSLSGLYDITYNGEVYNFLELRGDIEGEGFRFRSDSDTEVILAAFERWGPDCLLRFNGMWSFAIWNRRRRTLFLSRDRFGIKPLYVAIGPRRFAFASEPKAFLHLDGFAPVADIRAVEARLAAILFTLRF